MGERRIEGRRQDVVVKLDARRSQEAKARSWKKWTQDESQKLNATDQTGLLKHLRSQIILGRLAPRRMNPRSHGTLVKLAPRRIQKIEVHYLNLTQEESKKLRYIT